MGIRIVASFLVVAAALASAAYASASDVRDTAQGPTKPPETLVLAEKAPLGRATFSHLNHTTKNYNVEGTGPVTCVECHHVEQPAKDEKPSLLPEIPQIKSENSTAIITLTNQQAFHRACAGCHDQVVKTRPDARRRLLRNA